MKIPKPTAPSGMNAPSEALSGVDEIEMMYKLMVLALQTDSTRVLTYRLPNKRLLKSIPGAVANPHSISHYTGNASKIKSSKLRDNKHSELLSGFFDNLKACKEVDGSSLFDNLSLAFGSNIRSIHTLENTPTLVAGKGGHLKLGHNIVLDSGTPLNDVWLSMLHGVGVRVKKHGDSRGIISTILS